MFDLVDMVGDFRGQNASAGGGWTPRPPNGQLRTTGAGRTLSEGIEELPIEQQIGQVCDGGDCAVEVDV